MGAFDVVVVVVVAVAVVGLCDCDAISTLVRPGKNAVEGGVGGNGPLFVAAAAAAAFSRSK